MTLNALLFILCLPILANAQLRTGNAGNGAFVNGHLYVTDLVAAGNNLNPYMGRGHSGYFENLIHIHFPFSESLNIDKSLLATKLADLNSILPGLGEAVFTGMRAYRWELSYDSDFVTDDCDDGACPRDTVKIAVRRYQHIYISADFWNLLDPRQRIALLIHEVLFAFASVHRENGFEMQGAAVARKINGKLFDSPELRDSVGLSDDLYRFFSLNPLRNFCADADSKYIKMSRLRTDLNLGYVSEAEQIFLFDLWSPRWHTKVTEACAAYAQQRRYVSLEVFLPILWVSTSVYLSSFGTQQALTLNRQVVMRKRSWKNLSPQACYENVMEQVSETIHKTSEWGQRHLYIGPEMCRVED